MWELDCEEGWTPNNWCFWTAVLEKTLESPLDCKEIHPAHSEEDQPWDFFGRNDAIAETPVLCPPHAKSWLIGKDSDAGRHWGQEEKGMTEDKMAGWHPWLDGHESEWTPGVGDGQGGLVCCDSWGRRFGHNWVNWTELKERSKILLQYVTMYRTPDTQQRVIWSYMSIVLRLRNSDPKESIVKTNWQEVHRNKIDEQITKV